MAIKRSIICFTSNLTVSKWKRLSFFLNALFDFLSPFAFLGILIFIRNLKCFPNRMDFSPQGKKSSEEYTKEKIQFLKKGGERNREKSWMKHMGLFRCVFLKNIYMQMMSSIVYSLPSQAGFFSFCVFTYYCPLTTLMEPLTLLLLTFPCPTWMLLPYCYWIMCFCFYKKKLFHYIFPSKGFCLP